MKVLCTKIEGSKVDVRSKDGSAQVVVWTVTFVPVDGARVPIQIVYTNKAQALTYDIDVVYTLSLTA